MTIHEYGDRDKPHILLVHGMWMCHEMMLPYVEKMRNDYHIIAPDLTGHGDDMGNFSGAEVDAIKIGKWLADHDIKTMDLMFSASLGCVVAMYIIADSPWLTVKCSVMEGAALTRMRGVEWMFRAMMGGMQKHHDAIYKMYSSVSVNDGVAKKIADSIGRTDKKALACMVHTCNSFKYEQSLLPENIQRRLFFEFGSKDPHIVCRKLIQKFYPKSVITVRKGYGHCAYMFKHQEEYSDILRNYMERADRTFI